MMVISDWFFDFLKTTVKRSKNRPNNHQGLGAIYTQHWLRSVLGGGSLILLTTPRFGFLKIG
jgi:hypothetical protein